MSGSTHVDDFGKPGGRTDEQIIKDGDGAPCRICWTIYARLRLTWRYCSECRRAFCEGEHGSFRTIRRQDGTIDRVTAICVRCFSDAGGNLK